MIFDFAVMIFSRILLVCFKFFPVWLSRVLLVLTYLILSWIEKKWFLYYVQKGLNYPQTIQAIRRNPVCLSSVEKIYNFWIANPDHAAFNGLMSEKSSDKGKTWVQTSKKP